jgi:hypothetical protein
VILYRCNEGGLAAGYPSLTWLWQRLEALNARAAHAIFPRKNVLSGTEGRSRGRSEFITHTASVIERKVHVRFGQCLGLQMFGRPRTQAITQLGHLDASKNGVFYAA